ncbi:MAG: tRNA pseudouridine(38-40) synthase TruA [Treponema sp.]|nr:tRNA pseudouridine(38-40) synthase TruA [Treponema sp.]
MTNILLTLSYDGTDFCGWQRQDKAAQGEPVRTVQGEIELALEKMFRQKIKLYGSGRTDSGVHAHGQAANFMSPSDNIPVENYIRAINGLLPHDIRVMRADIKDESFNSRFDATSRTYRYFMHTSLPEARDMRYVWKLRHHPNLDTLNEMCSILKGEIDFSTFTAAGDQSLSTFRYIEKASFEYQGDILVFEIEANAFLWKMVRSITGTLITLEREGKKACDFKAILESRDRSKAVFTAPPTGLFLWEVKFDGIRRHV